jgi:hypothetical protein
MRRLLLLWIAINCGKSFGQAIEPDARTAKPLPLQLVAAIRKEIGTACQLPEDNVRLYEGLPLGRFPSCVSTWRPCSGSNSELPLQPNWKLRFLGL